MAKNKTINCKNAEPLKDILTESELAEYLGVSTWTVRRFRQNEGLPVLRFKKVRSVLYYRPAVDDWLRSLSAPAESNDATEQDSAAEEKEPLSKGLSFSALPYTPHEMELATHEHELPPVYRTIVRVAESQMGVAGDDTWGARVLPEYLIQEKEQMRFRFAFRGI